MTFSWPETVCAMRATVRNADVPLDGGQRDSLSWIGKRLPECGVVLADEVGTGKTRIACAVVRAVLDAGGRAAVVVPHGLIHQWETEMRKLSADAPAPKVLTTMADFVKDAKSKEWSTIAPGPGNPEWMLLSHGFRAPQVRVGNWPAEWRVALPSYVRAELSSAARRRDARTKIGRLLSDPNEILQNIAGEISDQVTGADRHKLRARIDQLTVYKHGGNNHALIGELQQDSGRWLMEELLGLWLGPFDLLVIDEAHKSRSDMNADGRSDGAAARTVLARLVDVLLKQPVWGRRLCLTATPMELELLQWLDLLARAGCDFDRAEGQSAIERLQDAARRGAVAPDEGPRLDDLCNAARNFRRALAPYVTRRRRDEDPLVHAFRQRVEVHESVPHPHRHLERVKIGWSEAIGPGKAWLDVLFAAEGMSHSARGLSHADTEGWPRAVRDAYTKLSAGHVSVDLSETNLPIRVPGPDEAEEYTRSKIARVAYWYRRLRDARRKVIEANPDIAFDPDCEHPRIIAAVREIESWTGKGEKVLVFGVFLRPLRLLRDVLNVRFALRMADAGRPLAHALHMDAELVGIAACQLNRMREEGVIIGRLVNAGKDDMRRGLLESHKAYEKLRRQVRDGAKKHVADWRRDPLILGGGYADHELDAALQDHLVSFVLDNFLAGMSQGEEVARERIDALADDFLRDFVTPLLEDLEEDEEEEQAILRQEAVRRALLEDAEGRQSLHARLLQGETKWETRRYLQAAFNRRDASPMVLIAQSQVGREGLNLHEACRVVVQFHAEWNPAVLEQQIGRVDRKGSLWEKKAQEWLENGVGRPPPYIEVRQLIFEGTYDAYQWDRVMRRQQVFDASLFGSLLPADVWNRVPSDRVQGLLEAAPCFRPPASGLPRRGGGTERLLH